jgi:16S rRNA (guanine966-N2)-methyltransferase
MRVIGGKLSGRRFGATRGRGTRPTADRVREGLASALQSRGALEGAVVLDLFAGTGALGFEALSRGAAMVIAADQDPRVIKQLKRSAEELGLEAAVQGVRLDLLGDAATAIRRLPKTGRGFDLVFVDAPYAAIDRVPALLDQLAAQGRLAPGAWIAVERPATHDWRWPNGLAPEAEYRYGQTGISLGAYQPGKGNQ